MRPSPERPADAQAEGISLDALGAAFARALQQGSDGESSGDGPDRDHDPSSASGNLPDSEHRCRDTDGDASIDTGQGGSAAVASDAATEPSGSDDWRDAEAGDDTGDHTDDHTGDDTGDPAPFAVEPVDQSTDQADDAQCPITPGSILEAMLFVGDREGRPLPAEQLAGPMRDVEPAEIPELVASLNHRYRRRGCPYEVVSLRGGYTMRLRTEYYRLRDRFHGRVREARLSQAAVDVLAVVAYRQPLTSEQVGKLRGKPAGHLLSQLVRRRLLQVERREVTGEKGRRRRVAQYRTTDRFLELFALESLEDLPRSEELDR